MEIEYLSLTTKHNDHNIGSHFKPDIVVVRFVCTRYRTLKSTGLLIVNHRSKGPFTPVYSLVNHRSKGPFTLVYSL